VSINPENDERWYLDRLACPECAAPLARSQRACGCGFSVPDGTPLDLRPRRPVMRSLRLPAGTTAPEDFKTISLATPNVTYDGPRALRDSAELFSAVAESLRPMQRLLDLGCGPRDQAKVAAHYGLRYAGVDYSSPAADMLADAHALPFAAASFDLVFSYAVFEHLHNPYMAAAEVARILVPGGLFFGVVSQGEPFHESYFHHTGYGVLALLTASGFAVERIWPSYDTLHALATMGRYPRLIRGLIEILHRFTRATPFLAPRAFFRSSQRDKDREAIFRTAGICFVARRKEPAS
jgi:SAM-dependent methyltransferase